MQPVRMVGFSHWAPCEDVGQGGQAMKGAFYFFLASPLRRKKKEHATHSAVRILMHFVLPALLQKLVGEFFFDFSHGNLENLVGNLEGIFQGFFLTHRTKAQKFRGKFRSIFRKKIRGSKKIFRAKFTLQTCHLNTSAGNDYENDSENIISCN